MKILYLNECEKLSPCIFLKLPKPSPVLSQMQPTQIVFRKVAIHRDLQFPYIKLYSLSSPCSQLHHFRIWWDMPEPYHLFNGLIMFTTCLLHRNTMGEVAKHHTNIYVCIYRYKNIHINKIIYMYNSIQHSLASFSLLLSKYIMAHHLSSARHWQRLL